MRDDAGKSWRLEYEKPARSNVERGAGMVRALGGIGLILLTWVLGMWSGLCALARLVGAHRDVAAIDARGDRADGWRFAAFALIMLSTSVLYCWRLWRSAGGRGRV